MSIRYILLKNNLNDKKGYVARVQPIGTLDMDEVIEHMLHRGSTVGRADVLAVLALYHSVIQDLVLQGYNVSTSLANFRVRVQGLFDDWDDKFDRRRHRVVAQTVPGKEFRQAIERKARLTRGRSVGAGPHPRQYTDVNSGARNSTLTPGGIGRLWGWRLKFDPADPDQGIFIRPLEEGRRAIRSGEVQVRVVAQNEPRVLIFQVPPLPPGDYRLVVRASTCAGGPVHEGDLYERLTVAAEAAVEETEPTLPALAGRPQMAPLPAPALVGTPLLPAPVATELLLPLLPQSAKIAQRVDDA